MTQQIADDKTKASRSIPKRRMETQEFGSVQKVKYFDSLHYRTEKKYFQPIVPRQFLMDDTYYHHKRHRLPAWDELFLDLVYVAVIYQVGEILKESPISGEIMNHFLLVMIPVWMTWALMDRFNNIFGSSTFTYKAFSWIYHLFVASLGIYAPNAFHAEAADNTSNAFLICYFGSQLFAFFFGLTVGVYFCCTQDE